MAAPVIESVGSAVSGNALYSSGGLDVPKPSGTVENDLMICFAAGAVPWTTVPSGWTEIFTSTHCDSAAWYKVAGSSEPTTYNWGSTYSENALMRIVRISGVDTADPIDVHGLGVGYSSADPPIPSITTTVADALLIAVGYTNTGSSPTVDGPPSGYTQAFASTTSVEALAVAHKTQATAGATGSTTYPFTNNGLKTIGLHLAVAPSAGGGTPTISSPGVINVLSDRATPQVTLTF